MTLRFRRTLGLFHHRVALCLAGIQLKQNTLRRCKYLHLVASMAASGLEEMETYVLHVQNIIDQYIVTRMVMELCLAAELQMGPCVTRR